MFEVNLRVSYEYLHTCASDKQHEGAISFRAELTPSS